MNQPRSEMSKIKYWEAKEFEKLGMEYYKALGDAINGATSGASSGGGFNANSAMAGMNI